MAIKGLPTQTTLVDKYGEFDEAIKDLAKEIHELAQKAVHEYNQDSTHEPIDEIRIRIGYEYPLSLGDGVTIHIKAWLSGSVNAYPEEARKLNESFKNTLSRHLPSRLIRNSITSSIENIYIKHFDD